jgi:uncharacterized protein
MPANANEKIAELLKPMLKKRLFVALNKAIARPEDMLPFVAEHLAYMNQLENEGKLFASGPFIQEGVLVGDGSPSCKPARSKTHVRSCRPSH